jgi:glutathione S-transferase
MVEEPRFILLGWRVSWYTAKVRSYLQHRGIAHLERKPSLWTYKKRIPQHCGGDAAVPVLVTPEGEWWQDSTEIIARLESRFPSAPATPAGPLQRFAARLIEIWADEFWHATAEHYRFSFPDENYPVWRDELRSLLPGFPRFMQHALTGQFRRIMLGVTRDVGVTPESIPLVERWSVGQLDALEQHLAGMPYLFGTRASIADFALMGPINGHLAHDPHPRRHLVESRPHLAAWLQRMSQPRGEPGNWLADDELPASLGAVFGSLGKELVPYLAHCARLLAQLAPSAGHDRRYTRMGPLVEVPFGDGTLRRIVLPYVLWMVQRLLDDYRALPPGDAARIRSWLEAIGGARLLALQIPRLRRQGLHVAPEVAPAPPALASHMQGH